LEIGAHPASSPDLAHSFNVKHFVGLNLDISGAYDWGEICIGNANHMDFADASFDAVISNAMLEHDQRFWLTLAEVRRVLRPGGIFYCGVPGYAARSSRWRSNGVLELQRRLAGRPIVGPLVNSRMYEFASGVATFPFHAAPSDYYRFSDQAVRSVLMEGYEILEFAEVMALPRFTAVGRKL
jgi:SAM-dependent methyltransferase